MFNFFKKPVIKLEPRYVVRDIVFNVANFNLWFCASNNGATYANTGIFGRTSKLGQDHVNEYLKLVFNLDPESFTYEEKATFLDMVVMDWLKR